MARKRYKPEEIVAKFRQVDVLVSQGQNGGCNPPDRRERTLVLAEAASLGVCATPANRLVSNTGLITSRSIVIRSSDGLMCALGDRRWFHSAAPSRMLSELEWIEKPHKCSWQRSGR
jgi:hypothetical protein